MPSLRLATIMLDDCTSRAVLVYRMGKTWAYTIDGLWHLPKSFDVLSDAQAISIRVAEGRVN